MLATLLRPVGGALSDQIGGARVLSGVFAGLIPFALLLMWPSMIPFTVGALGCAALLGLGNGAVFKLVPQYFPASTATVTGLVGAIGGLGRLFSAAASWIFSRHFRRGLAWVWPARMYVILSLAVESACVYDPAGCCGARAATVRYRAGPNSSAPRLGVDGNGSASGGDSGRVAQSSEFRPCPCDLHVCGDLRHLGNRVSLRSLAQQASDAAILRTKL